MLRQRQKLHQELFKSVKEKQEREQDAYLPPGLINHGNTCFMNSVLQGLIASQELYDLVHFNSNRQSFQTGTSGPILAKRSPQLTNDHGLGGSADHKPVNSMPLGDAFVRFLLRAWYIQDNRRREISTPKEVLAILGRKYDQYLDFRQQDAHEFLRLLLDAMRMEELDVIKRVQPRPPKSKRKSKVPQPHAVPGTPEISPEERLQSFIDMLFGGKLASFLVCETCKHISHTYEDFNDLSLSIKPEDFVKERKRNKFKSLAKKFTGRYDTDRPPMSRASSVPPGLMRKGADDPPEHTPETVDPRVRSQENLRECVDSDVDVAPYPNSLSSPAVLVPNGPHVEFAEPEKSKKPDPDRWVKLSKRISRGVQGKKDERSRSRGRSSRPDDEYLKVVLITSEASGRNLADVTLPNTRETTPNPSEPSSNVASPLLKPTKPLISDIIHLHDNGKSHKRGFTAAKSAYLRHILADTTPVNHNNPFAVLLSGVSNVGTSAQNGYTLWNKFSQIPSVEESLRMFTSVEMMEGENMVGCRNCWKLANRPKENQGDSSDTSESDRDALDPPSGPPRSSSPSFSPLPPPITSSTASEPMVNPSPTSPASTSVASLVRSDFSPDLESKGPSAISLPSAVEATTFSSKPYPLLLDRPEPDSAGSPDLSPDISQPVTYAGFTIPLISTTGPETPMTATTASPSLPPTSIYNLASASLNPPRVLRRRTPRRQPAETDSSDDSFDDTDASCSDASSAGSASASPFASQEDLSKNPSIDATLSSPKFAELEKPKIPRSKQVVMRKFYKRYLIADPPLILVVHLKRFQQTSKTPFMSFSAGFKKLDDYVAFPEYLDITPFLAPNKEDFGLPIRKLRQNNRAKGKCIYRLYAVVVHIGNIWGGHYVAYTALPQRGAHLNAYKATESVGSTPAASDESLRSGKTDKAEKHEKHDKPDKREKGHKKHEPRQWAHISDTVVRLTTIDEVLKSKAYMCLYERIS